MKLFTPVVPKERFHKHFSSVLIPFRKPERELLEVWAEGFVDRDGKLVEEFQTTFNSSFWEIYLHGLFKEYGFIFDWGHASPDFLLNSSGLNFVVEATTANAAQGKPNEWDRLFNRKELESIRRFTALNTEAIIRLSNAILSKVKKYETMYKKLSHVKGKPFVIAIAPFEQPLFNHQHDRPIRALLYDHYVDEDAHSENPDAFPNGPPSVKLGYVTKDNGAEIPLGFFNDPGMAEVSAIVFSCTATWGKLSAMSENPLADVIIDSVWGTPPNGAPEKRHRLKSEHEESIFDGLQVYHNPYATYPLPPEVFRRSRVIQHFLDPGLDEWVHEGNTEALLFRLVHSGFNGKSVK